MGCLAAPIICLDGFIEAIFLKRVVMHGHGQRKPHAELRRLGRISHDEAGYREDMVGKLQEPRQRVGVDADRADRTDAQAFSLGRDHERGQGNRGIDRGVEEGIEMIVGEMPVALFVDSTLPSIVAAEDEKVGNVRKPFLAQRAVSQQRADL